MAWFVCFPFHEMNSAIQCAKTLLLNFISGKQPGQSRKRTKLISKTKPELNKPEFAKLISIDFSLMMRRNQWIKAWIQCLFVQFAFRLSFFTFQFAVQFAEFGLLQFIQLLPCAKTSAIELNQTKLQMTANETFGFRNFIQQFSFSPTR